MQLTMLKAKLHHGRVSNVALEQEGSCRIDKQLLDAAGIMEFEQVNIYNLENGERITTYVMAAEPGCREININGAAAHKANTGDRIIICSYALLSQSEAINHQPAFIFLGEDNSVIRSENAAAIHVA